MLNIKWSYWIGAAFLQTLRATSLIYSKENDKVGNITCLLSKSNWYRGDSEWTGAHFNMFPSLAGILLETQVRLTVCAPRRLSSGSTECDCCFKPQTTRGKRTRIGSLTRLWMLPAKPRRQRAKKINSQSLRSTTGWKVCLPQHLCRRSRSEPRLSNGRKPQNMKPHEKTAFIPTITRDRSAINTKFKNGLDVTNTLLVAVSDPVLVKCFCV